MNNPDTQAEKEHKLIKRLTEKILIKEIMRNIMDYCVGGMAYNSYVFGPLEMRKPILDSVMEALGDPNTNIIGVCSSNDDTKTALIDRVSKIIRRDNLFDVIVMASVTKNLKVTRIQEEIAQVLGLKLGEKSRDGSTGCLRDIIKMVKKILSICDLCRGFNRDNVAVRARLLNDRIKKEDRILVILCDLWKGLNLGRVGIPFGVDHPGCKILLTSASEDVLSIEMKAEKVVFLPGSCVPSN